MSVYEAPDVPDKQEAARVLVRRVLGERIRAAFTDRYGGCSEPPYAQLNLGGSCGDDPQAVRRNRFRVARELGLDPGGVVWMRQQHGSDVVSVHGRPDGAPPAADGTVTTVSGIALAVLVADCVPVLLAESSAGVVGAAHAGRPGLARGVIPALVARAAGLGAVPSRMAAVLGPAICGGCYEVPDEMRREVASVAPAAWRQTRSRTPGLDIGAGVEEQLRAAGVTDISRDPRCTQESAEVYSYRRDGRTGRFAGYVWLEGAAQP